MTKRRIPLVVARLSAGYRTQDDFAIALRKEGANINQSTYKNIESGRGKNVDVVLAIKIAKKLGRNVEDIFLPEST